MSWRRSLTVAAGVLGLVTTGLIGPANAAQSGTSEIVRTDKGQVRGVVHADHRLFQGIPFAAPPVGNLRWKPAKQTEPWNDTLDATQPRSQCAQPSGFGYPATYNEDCLYLNVTTPRTATGARPVMVWFHGGGYLIGNSHSYDPRKLAVDGDVIVVTVNYRLGTFGFLALPSLSAETPGIQSGNFGIEDQQAALRWVQRNALAFGGDPGKVTIFGQSAGASSVCMNVVSPSAAGLFHRAIAESGSCASAVRTKQVAETGGAQFAATVGCTNPAIAAQCLRAKPAQDLVGAWPEGLPPVVGGYELPLQPADALRQSRYNHVPLLLGNTRDEMRLFVSLAFDLMGTPVTPEQYVQIIQLTYGPNADRVLEQYPLANYPTPSIALAAVQTDNGLDLLSTCSHLTSYKLASASPWPVPVYAYQFADRTAPPLVDVPNFDEGAEHSSELNYLFSAVPLGRPLNAEQQVLSNTMVKYWTTFARTGNPNGTSTPTWPQFRSATDVLALDLGPNGIRPFDVNAASKCDFWSSLATR